ncbi:MAG: hypothetical protein P9X22_07810 [Candidatus Zapsychrus exili]|nr:hypothetical protein [Candidatus Zapsychrus exili]
MKIIRSKEKEFNSYWLRLFENSTFQYPLYQSGNILYYKACVDGAEFEDCSFVVEEGKKSILGVLASINIHSSGLRELCGQAVIPVFFVEDTSCEVGKLLGAHKLLKQELDDILDNHAINRVFYQDFLISGKLSFLGKHLLNRGATVVPFFTQVLNLSDSEFNLGAQVRKSYKSLINWGEKNMVLRILDKDSISADDMEDFRKLHFSVVGRETRPQSTWDLQYDMVVKNEAFAVFGELEGELVTAALFPCSSKYCFYGVSASKRELFDKPLSHAVVWKAIVYAKRIGCRYFETGMQSYSGQDEQVKSPKDFNISMFKHGFGGQTYAKLNITWNNVEARTKKA